jgi:hypothetical protein
MIDEDAAIIINGSIMPEFNHLKSLIFLLITLGIFSDSMHEKENKRQQKMATKRRNQKTKAPTK